MAMTDAQMEQRHKYDSILVFCFILTSLIAVLSMLPSGTHNSEAKMISTNAIDSADSSGNDTWIIDFE